MYFNGKTCYFVRQFRDLLCVIIIEFQIVKILNVPLILNGSVFICYSAYFKTFQSIRYFHLPWYHHLSNG
jgi:hypothetical protein